MFVKFSFFYYFTCTEVLIGDWIEIKKLNKKSTVPQHREFEKWYFKAYSDENKVSGPFMTQGKV